MRRSGMDKKYLAMFGIFLGFMGSIMCGCGYQLAGSGRLPHGIKRLLVVEPLNHTAETRLISNVSNEIKSELTRHQVHVVDILEEADGVLVSEIVSLTDTTIARRGETTALEKRLEMGMDAKLETPKGDVLWMGEKIVANETYAVISGDDSTTRSNRETAILELSKRLAEDLYNRLTSDF